jgi:plasmid stabilization system protein ParE
MAFRVAPQAESDLDEIWYFLAKAATSTSVTAQSTRSPRASRFINLHPIPDRP